MRRVVCLVLDGLRRDSVTPDDMPALHGLAACGTWFAAHRTVFPSLTRVASASFATGCHPARHGLQANTVALERDGALVLADAGEPDFLDRKREATGTMLDAPTMAERLAPHGGYVLYGNQSPGAARAHDPGAHGTVRNRAAAWGGHGAAPLGTAADAEGDAAMVARFVAEAVHGPAAAVAWCAEPDHAQHASPLGSPTARAALRAADDRVGDVRQAVAARRAAGEDVLLLVASDHGHDTAAEAVDVDAVLEAAGIRRGPGDRGLMAVANGHAALLYALPDRAADLRRALGHLAEQPWAGRVMDADALAALGQRPANHLVGAVAMRWTDAPNAHGVRGTSITAHPAFGKPDRVGHGMHGGLGEGEQMPVLVAEGDGFGAATVTLPTSLVDIAPTVLHHLRAAAAGMDGRPLRDLVRARFPTAAA